MEKWQLPLPVLARRSFILQTNGRLVLLSPSGVSQQPGVCCPSSCPPCPALPCLAWWVRWCLAALRKMENQNWDNGEIQGPSPASSPQSRTWANHSPDMTDLASPETRGGGHSSVRLALPCFLSPFSVSPHAAKTKNGYLGSCPLGGTPGPAGMELRWDGMIPTTTTWEISHSMDHGAGTVHCTHHAPGALGWAGRKAIARMAGCAAQGPFCARTTGDCRTATAIFGWMFVSFALLSLR